MFPVETLLLKRVYEEVVDPEDRLPGTHFFRALHNFIREELSVRDAIFKDSPQLQKFVEEHIRKGKKALGEVMQYKQRKCYNGLKLCAPNFETADNDALVQLQVYAASKKKRLPTDMLALDSSMDEAGGLPSPKRLKFNKKPENSWVKIKGTIFLRLQTDEEGNYVVQILKPGTSSLSIKGPDEAMMYSVKGNYDVVCPLLIPHTHPQDDEAYPKSEGDFNNFPSGEFSCELRVPNTNIPTPAEELSYENEHGIITIRFPPKQPTHYVTLK